MRKILGYNLPAMLVHGVCRREILSYKKLIIAELRNEK